MGTHPIFESDFDCLTECHGCQIWPNKARLFWIIWTSRRERPLITSKNRSFKKFEKNGMGIFLALGWVWTVEFQDRQEFRGPSGARITRGRIREISASKEAPSHPV